MGSVWKSSTTGVNRQKYRSLSTVQKFHGISNLTLLADLHGIPACKESLNWKTSSHALKTLFLDVTRPYYLLMSENTPKFFK